MKPEVRRALEARLEKIRLQNGGVLTPDAVVKDAKNRNSPLHEHFEWDDTKAAYQYRLDQARELIRKVRVEVVTSTHTVCAPMYVRDPRVDADKQGYAPVAELKDDRTVASDALRYEFSRAIALLERSIAIAETLGLADEVHDLLQRTRVLQQRVAA